MRSICGALARPSRRPTGRRSFTSTSVGMSVTLSLSAHSGDSDTSILAMRSRPRSLRARWASRLSIRRAGPDVEAVKKRRTGRPFLVGCMGGFDLGSVAVGIYSHPRTFPTCLYGYLQGYSDAAAAARKIRRGYGERHVLDARAPAACLGKQVHEPVHLGRQADLDRQAQGARLLHGDRIVVRVGAACELFCEGVNLRPVHPRGDELADELLYVPE